jgi:hypothetical protein
MANEANKVVRVRALGSCIVKWVQVRYLGCVEGSRWLLKRAVRSEKEDTMKMKNCLWSYAQENQWEWGGEKCSGWAIQCGKAEGYLYRDAGRQYIESLHATKEKDQSGEPAMSKLARKQQVATGLERLTWRKGNKAGRAHHYVTRFRGPCPPWYRAGRTCNDTIKWAPSATRRELT